MTLLALTIVYTTAHSAEVITRLFRGYFTNAQLPAPSLAGRLEYRPDVPSGIVRDTGTVWELLERFNVTATQFGIVGNGTTDSTAGFIALNKYLRENDGCTVTFAPGEYLSKQTNWLFSVKNVRVIGNGAKFRSISSSNQEYDMLGLRFFSGGLENIVLNTDFSGTGNQGNFVSVKGGASERTSEYQTTAQGSTAITLKVAREASRFAVGSWVLIMSHSNMPQSSHPPAVRYFEFKKIKAANRTTGVLTFDSPLKNSYDAQAPYEFNNGYRDARNTMISLNGVLPLNRAGNAQMPIDFGENWYVENIEILPHAAATSPIRGILAVTGVRNFHGRGIKARGLQIGVGDTVLLEDSDLRGFDCEPDKLLDTLIIRRSKLDRIVGGIGINNSIVEDSILTGTVGLRSRNVTIRNNEFTSATNAFGYFEHSPYWTIENLIVENNRFRQAASQVAPIAPNLAENSNLLTVNSIISTVGQTQIVTATMNNAAPNDLNSVRVGTLLRNNTKRGVVQRIFTTDDSMTTRLEVLWQTAVANATEIFRFRTVLNLTYRNNTVPRKGKDFRQLSTIPGTDAYAVQAADTVITGLSSGMEQTEIVNLPLNGQSAFIGIGGYIREIEVKVMRSTTGMVYIASALPGNVINFGVNTAVLGTRKIDSYAVALKSGDLSNAGGGTNVVVPPDFIDTIEISAAAMSNPAVHEGIIIIRYTKR